MLIKFVWQNHCSRARACECTRMALMPYQFYCSHIPGHWFYVFLSLCLLSTSIVVKQRSYIFYANFLLPLSPFPLRHLIQFIPIQLFHHQPAIPLRSPRNRSIDDEFVPVCDSNLSLSMPLLCHSPAHNVACRIEQLVSVGLSFFFLRIFIRVPPTNRYFFVSLGIARDGKEMVVVHTEGNSVCASSW